MAEYIEREAAYRFAQDQLKKETGAYSRGWNHAMNVMKGALHNNDALPAADVVPVRHGRWYMLSYDEAVCTCCGYDRNTQFESTKEAKERWDELPPFCEMCGARMDGDGE